MDTARRGAHCAFRAKLTIDLSGNPIPDPGSLRWLYEKHDGHALDLSGNPIDWPNDTSSLEIVERLRSKGVLVCLQTKWRDCSSQPIHVEAECGRNPGPPELLSLRG